MHWRLREFVLFVLSGVSVAALALVSISGPIHEVQIILIAFGSLTAAIAAPMIENKRSAEPGRTPRDPAVTSQPTRQPVAAVPSPPTEPLSLVGRDCELDLLDAQLAKQRAGSLAGMRVSADTRFGWAVIAMYGMPGVGKSALVTALWKRLSPTHHGSHVLVEWETGVPFEHDRLVRRVLIALGTTADWLAGASAEECRDRLGGKLREAGNLVLIDGLAEGADCAELEAFLESFELKRANSTLLIVGRTKPTGFNTDQLFEVRPLSDEASSSLLRKLLGGTARSHSRELAEIVWHCAGLPRALLAAYANVRDGRTLPDVARDLRNPDTCLAVLSGAGTKLAAELAFSYPHLNGRLRRALAAISLLRSESVCAWAVSAITGDTVIEVEGWLADLEDVQLLTAEKREPADVAEPPRYRCHPLVRLALAQHNADACAAYALSRTALDGKYVEHSMWIYDRWWHDEPIENRRLDLAEGRSVAVMRWLRLEHRDVLCAVSEALRAGDDVPCWSFAQMVAGFFPVISCDWDMWREYFAQAKTAARDGDPRHGPPQRNLAIGAIVQAQALLCLFAGQLDEAQPLLKESLDAAHQRATRDPDVQIRGYVHLAELLMERGRYPEAHTNVREATNIKDPRSVDADQDWAGFVAAVVIRNLDPTQWSQVKPLEVNRDRLRASGDPTRHSRMSLYLGDALREIGKGRRAQDEYDCARRHAERAGDLFTAARAKYSLAYLMLDWGETAAAADLIKQIRPAYNASPDEIWLRRFNFLEARADFVAGDLPKARAALQLLHAHSAPEKDSWLHANAVLLLAEAYLKSGSLTDAARVIDEAEAKFAEIQYHWAQAQAEYLLGEISLRGGSLKVARHHLGRAREQFARCGDVRAEHRARRALARAWHPLRFVRSTRHKVMAWRLERQKLRSLTPPVVLVDSPAALVE